MNGIVIENVAGDGFGMQRLSVFERLRMVRTMEEVTGVSVGFSRRDAIISRLIRWATGAIWSHTFLRFETKCGVRIVEAVSPAGVIGPNLAASGRNDKGYEETVIPLTMSAEEAREKYLIALTWIGAATYSQFQLIEMGLYERWGWRVPKSIGRVVCSELVARVVYPQADLRGGRGFDEVTPGSIYEELRAKSIEQGAKRI